MRLWPLAVAAADTDMSTTAGPLEFCKKDEVLQPQEMRADFACSS